MLVYDSSQSRYQLKALNRQSTISLKIKKKDSTPVKFKWYAVWRQMRRHSAIEWRTPCKLTGNYWKGQRCHMAQITAENGLPIISESPYLKRRLWYTRINLLQRMKNSRSISWDPLSQRRLCYTWLIPMLKMNNCLPSDSGGLWLIFWCSTSTTKCNIKLSNSGTA